MDIYAPGWTLVSSIIAIIVMGYQYMTREELVSKFWITKVLYHLIPMVGIFLNLTLFPMDLMTENVDGFLVAKLGFPEWLDRILLLISPIGFATICWREPPSFSFKVKQKW